MDKDQFQKNLKKGVTLVDFNANWCAPCRAQEPVIKRLITLYQNRASIIEINIDENQALAKTYMVQSIPTIIIFKDGKEMKRLVGLQFENSITKILEDIL
ncbi:thioredoxin family protein [Desulfobacula sp.]|uniref:thioredoxin family protein n=1 Tax=Desulfobacula sp. TaxID=2593537 RepID=UPI00260BEE92|nr:thioredoxin family protein [Desulfobacula sp.]